jgi:hypothetical protein
MGWVLRLAIRSRHKGERHIEVRVGNIETPGAGRQVFGAVAKSDTDILKLIGRTLETMGRTRGTRLTAFAVGFNEIIWIDVSAADLVRRGSYEVEALPSSLKPEGGTIRISVWRRCTIYLARSDQRTVSKRPGRDKIANPIQPMFLGSIEAPCSLVPTCHRSGGRAQAVSNWPRRFARPDRSHAARSSRASMARTHNLTPLSTPPH